MSKNVELCLITSRTQGDREKERWRRCCMKLKKKKKTKFTITKMLWYFQISLNYYCINVHYIITLYYHDNNIFSSIYKLNSNPQETKTRKKLWKKWIYDRALIEDNNVQKRINRTGMYVSRTYPNSPTTASIVNWILTCRDIGRIINYKIFTCNELPTANDQI